MSKRFLFFLALAVVLLMFLGGLIAWTYVSRDMLGVPLARMLPWPVSCSTRGCITTRAWANQVERAENIARATKYEIPTQKQVLNTLIRQHLAHFGQLRSPIGIKEAQRYRRDILNMPDEKVAQAAGLSPYEYDQYFIVPFLEQESLRQERSAESVDELYRLLAGERYVFVLPAHLKWDRSEGRLK
jgi:hypothetical protein